MGIFSLIPMLMTILGDLPKVVSAIQFLIKAINDAEATGLSGSDKLTAVLNDFEGALNAINPTWGGDFAPIASAVEAVVGDIVGLYNDFAHAAPSTAPVAASAPAAA